MQSAVIFQIGVIRSRHPGQVSVRADQQRMEFGRTLVTRRGDGIHSIGPLRSHLLRRRSSRQIERHSPARVHQLGDLRFGAFAEQREIGGPATDRARALPWRPSRPRSRGNLSARLCARASLQGPRRRWYNWRVDDALGRSLQYLKGVGPQRAALLAERGICCLEDLFHYLPFRYEDRTHFATIRSIQPGQVVTLRVLVESGGLLRYARARKAVFHLLVRDATGVLHCRFFHSGYLEGRFQRGQELVLHGKADYDPLRPARLEMINPQVEVLGSEPGDSTEVGRIVPIYEAIGTISSRMMRRIVHHALAQLPATLPDSLPARIRAKYNFPSLREALSYAHFPPTGEDLERLNGFRSPAHRRLIFEDFFFFQLSLAMRRRNLQRRPGIAYRVREPRIREALKRVLPFKPTKAQKRVLGEIVADLEKPEPMARLLEGDVGSGKTIVALEAAVIAMENGYQVALMAPTEILAVQHFLSARRIVARTPYVLELLISGLRPAQKSAALGRIATGEAQLVVGTHALIEEGVRFAKLGLVIVDEQHRFGVLQRKELLEKGAAPDMLVMTATPIPRTLALTLYGDLDSSVIDEMPPGRTPVETALTSEQHLPGVWERVRREVARGRQAYVVYPVIEESPAALKAAITEYERLSRDVFPQLRVGLLHGRLKSAQKEEVMEKFRRNELQVLVATSVIEVGVDVPNATLMVIEHADRFGLSQLHQLRGRIGRGSEKSWCLLVAPRELVGDARERLETMVRTSNGFEIAETDLKLRGPGEFFGTRQHGLLGFPVANPLRDRELLELARLEAFAFSEDPNARQELLRIGEQLGSAWHKRYQLAEVG
jgi:ATP-dependent DNA helicase RecG